MATTVRQILDAAYAKSLKNRPGTIATESTELLELVKRSTRGLFAVGARVNPYFYGADETLAHDGTTGWARPEEAELVFRLEGRGTVGGNVADGDEVHIVSFEDRDAEELLPSVYTFGQVYRPAGNAADPNATDELQAYYSKRPADVASLAAEIDPLWPEQFNELLILDVAIYLALKEGQARADEVNSLRPERDQWANQYIAFLEHETPFVRRRWGHIQRFTTQSLVPLHSLLAGGSQG